MKPDNGFKAIPKNAEQLTGYARSPTIDIETVLDGEPAVPCTRNPL